MIKMRARRGSPGANHRKEGKKEVRNGELAGRHEKKKKKKKKLAGSPLHHGMEQATKATRLCGGCGELGRAWRGREGRPTLHTLFA